MDERDRKRTQEIIEKMGRVAALEQASGRWPVGESDLRERRAEVEAGRRWLLVEESRIDGGYAFTTDYDIEGALAAGDDNEYAEDWDPKALVDLTTGEVRPLSARRVTGFDPLFPVGRL